jgi:hypothetical protein
MQQARERVAENEVSFKVQHGRHVKWAWINSVSRTSIKYS